MSRRRVLTSVSALVLAATFLGGCHTVPALSDPVPPPPGTPQKTITELRAQTVDLVNDAIAASGIPTAWVSSAV